MAQQPIVVAHFKERSDAQKAVAGLVEAGFARTSAQILPEEGSSTYTRSSTTTSYDHTNDEGGFWSSLGDLPLPDEDRYAYAEGMSRGGVTVSLAADDEARAVEAMDILERHGAVDLDQQEESWRSEGWAGYTAGATGGDTTSTRTTTTTTTAAALATSGTAAGATLGRDDETLSRVEERLVVGKRQAAGGRVRVRSYVVETPFEEQVTLHDERVHVERRTVDRPAQPGDGVFAERVIEASERSEEAVVTKEARVIEEIGLRKEADTRVETVRDTVRRQEVEVEDDRTTRTSGVTGGGTTTTTVDTDLSLDDTTLGRNRR